MSRNYRAPVLLQPDHIVDGFESRSAEQTDWIHRHARQSMSSGLSRVLVVTPPESEVVAAYYGWCMASVNAAEVPKRMGRGVGRYPQPVALLARLAVDLDHERQGLGAAMLRDVILRTVTLGEQIGCRGLLIHAETTSARDFYLHLIPELMSSPTDEMHLYLLMKDINRTLH